MKCFKLTLALVFLMILNQTIQAQTAEEYQSKGENFYTKKQYVSAIEAFTKALDLGEKDNYTYLLRGFCYLATNKFDESLSDFSQCCVSANEYYYKAYFYKGIIFSNTNQLDSALYCFTISITGEPENIDFLPHRALCYQRLGQDKEALEDYFRYLEKNPEDLNAIGNIILSQLHLEQYTEALKNYQKIETIDPDFFSSSDFGNRAIAKLHTSDYKGALADCNLSLEDNSKDADVMNTRGLAYIKMDKFKEAMKDLNRSITLDNKNINAYLNRGYLKIQMKDFSGALEDINRGNELGCNCSDVHFYRGIAYMNLKKPELALEEFDKAISLFKADLLYTEGEVYYQKGLCYKQLKETEKACANFKTSFDLGFSEGQKMMKQNCIK